YSGVKGEAVNIGSGKGVSVLELAEMMVKAGGKPLKPIFEKERLGDIKESVADVGKAKELLKWSAKVGLEEGLGEV
ncbi:LPS biosynthesis protein WbpP, partial [Candidatus Micrarchaeota archaeon CG11_big_fil_rev_8_21_14_0_20_47_5]